MEDLQNDFLPGGALAVPHSEEVIPVANRYLRRFSERRLPVFATRDWHPADHCSFVDQGGTWPVHCVAGTDGAAFAATLQLPPGAIIISKADCADREAYSALDGTDLEHRLLAARVRRLFIGGLATDYCVLHTVRDALQHGFTTILLEDAIRAVNVRPGDGARAEAEMVRLGAIPLRFHQILP